MFLVILVLAVSFFFSCLFVLFVLFVCLGGGLGGGAIHFSLLLDHPIN